MKDVIIPSGAFSYTLVISHILDKLGKYKKITMHMLIQINVKENSYREIPVP